MLARIRAELEKRGGMIGPGDGPIAAHAENSGYPAVTTNKCQSRPVDGGCW